MDYLTTWKEIGLALARGDLQRAIDMLDALEGYFRRYGYPTDKDFPTTVRLRGCRLVLAQINLELNQQPK